jgi:hypothetical protein
MERLAMTRLRRLAPYLIIGPISGPLLAGVVTNFRAGRPLLGALYALALVEYLVLLPIVAARLDLRYL